MLLLIVDDPNTFAKKELYAEALPVKGVLHANSLVEAEEIIAEKNQVDLLLINNILIEGVEYEIDELKKLNCVFSGAIILKVDDELLGIKLLKAGIITEYYLSDKNSEIELNNLREAFRLASLKHRISKSFCKINSNLQKINSLELSKR